MVLNQVVREGLMEEGGLIKILRDMREEAM